MRRFDVIVIGAGQAGPSLAARFDARGMSVALVERKLLGGTCVNTGCMPTKTLVASARAAWTARHAADYGVVLEGAVGIDMKKVRARAATVTRNAREGLESWLKGMKHVTVLEGHARFESAATLRVQSGAADEVIGADRIFVNVGGRASIPPMPGLEAVPYLTNTAMVELDTLPRHLVILGGSYVALEFAQMYRRFGSEVTVVERGPRLVSREDEDVSEAIKSILEREGVTVVLGAEHVAFSPGPGGDGTTVKIGAAADVRSAHASHVLVAVGRRPNTDDLGLDRAGVELDARGYIVVDDQLRTNVKGIWAMGDCNGRGAFTHTAYNDFEIVAANVLDDDPRRVSDRIDTYALYIDPPLGRAGMTETQARKSGRPLLIGTRPMTRVGRATERGETQGFIKIIADAETKKILGASILGIEGDEAIHGILDIMYAGAPYTTLQRSMGIHPTVSELLPTVLGDLKPVT